MNRPEFDEEMDKLEASCKRFGARNEKEERARREVTWEMIENFPLLYLTRARKEWCDDEESPMPLPGQIRAMCKEYQREERLNRPRRPHYEAIKHVCANPRPPYPKNGECRAFDFLKCFSNPGIYEACHIYCPGDIPATCPGCGKREIIREDSPITKLMQMFPEHAEEYKKWNPCWKGLMLCDECSAKGVGPND